jgi:predicted AlkP superfamily pyrophosphatase or phosphodiesterase
LDAKLQSHLGNNYRRVILILMDALALQRLQRWMADEGGLIWDTLLKNGLLAPLTSITPSTTSAALTTLWTGRSAAEHGILGYEMWLKEYGVVANTILHSPISYKDDYGSLQKAGFSPESFMSLPTLGPHLVAHGVRTYAFQHSSIAHSGLSQMLMRGAEVHSFATPAELWVNLRQLVERRALERQYIWVYWGEVDYFSHRYGPDDERAEAEFANFSRAMEHIFLNRLPQSARKDTLLVLTADHGMLATPADPHYDLRNHPGLTRRLHILPTGENRLALLFMRPGQTEAVQELIRRTWLGQFSLVDAPYAVEAGLFGPGDPHPRLLERCGETIAIAHGQAYWWWHAKENHLLGRHGGLHPEEMLVPFLAAEL